MEVEERPTKIRKLDQSSPNGSYPAELAGNSDSKPDEGEPTRGNDPQNGHTGTASQSTEQASSERSNRSNLAGQNVATEPAAAKKVPSGPSQIPNPLSKNQQKKLRRKEEWEAKRPERKAIRKEKIVARRERKKAAKEAAGPEAAAPQSTYRPPTIQLPVTIIIDCDFDDLMRDNERVSLASQVTRSYSDNRNSPFKAHLAISSFGGSLKDRFDSALNQHYKSWKGVRFLEADFVEVAKEATSWMQAAGGGLLKGAFSKFGQSDEIELEKLKQDGEVVYLSAEADDVLEELKPYSTYIIGGLVDKNREKGICYKRARQRGIRTARLPIGTYLEMQSRKVLTTNHVNEIMVRWLELGDWGEAFIKVIPKRKGGTLKGADDTEGVGSEICDQKDNTPDDTSDTGTKADDLGKE